MRGTLIVQCVYCKAKRTIDASSPEAQTMPMCEKDGGIMVLVKATAKK